MTKFYMEDINKHEYVTGDYSATGPNFVGRLIEGIDTGDYYFEVEYFTNSYNIIGVCTDEFSPSSYSMSHLSPSINMWTYEITRGYAQYDNSYRHPMGEAYGNIRAVVGVGVKRSTQSLEFFVNGEKVGSLTNVLPEDKKVYPLLGLGGGVSEGEIKLNMNNIQFMPAGYSVFGTRNAMVIKSNDKFYVQSSDRNAITEIQEANLEYAARYGSPGFTDFTKVIQTLQVLKNAGTDSEYLEPQVVEPFCLYDLFDNEVEVIYLTDEEVEPTMISIEYDWSPLDELGDDYELLVWKSSTTNPTAPSISLNAITKNQTLAALKPLYFEELEKITVNYEEVGCGKVFIHVSGDKGVTWQKYRAAALNALPANDLKVIFNQKEFMYKVELECDHNEDVATFSSIKINDKDYYATINFKDFLLSVESVMEKMPRIYVSYDNEATWVEVKQHEMNNLGQEEIEEMTLKVVLENGQQLYALAYSWI